jgi:hypothetical protein
MEFSGFNYRSILKTSSMELVHQDRGKSRERAVEQTDEMGK